MGNVILQHRGKARQKFNKEAECSNKSLGEKKVAVCSLHEKRHDSLGESLVT